MDDILELILELILEIVLEGAVGVVSSKKVPMIIRVLLAVVLLAFFVGIFGLLFWVGIKNNSLLLIGITAFLTIGLATMVYRKTKCYIKKHTEGKGENYGIKEEL